MTKDQMQTLWDLYLITGWKANTHILILLTRYVDQAAPILNKLECNKRKIKYLGDHVSLRIPGLFDLKKPVRAFIADHSMKLTNYLWDNEFKVDYVVENIARFKWQKKPYTNKRLSRERRAEVSLKTRQSFVIKGREIDKSHDWATVK